MHSKYMHTGAHSLTNEPAAGVEREGSGEGKSASAAAGGEGQEGVEIREGGVRGRIGLQVCHEREELQGLLLQLATGELTSRDAYVCIHVYMYVCVCV
jgi:hypothetical protein